MKTKQFFRPIIREAWMLTMSHKGWWLFGFAALFLMNSLSYQAVLSGLQVLTSPDTLLDQWTQWSVILDPISLAQGQLEALKDNPKAFISLLFVWLSLAIAGVLLFVISILGVTVIISGAKKFIQTQRMTISESLKESLFHIKSVFWSVLLAVVLSNLLIIVFSLPVIALGLEASTGGNILMLGILFSLFLIAAFFIAVMSIFTILGIVLDDYRLSQAIQASWGLLKRHLVVTIEMFLLHIVLAILLAIVLIVFVSLLVVPATIIGTLFVAAEQFSITSVLPLIVIILLYLGFAVLGSIFTFFQLLSWSFFYNKIDDIKPYSRIASFAEITLKIQP